MKRKLLILLVLFAFSLLLFKPVAFANLPPESFSDPDKKEKKKKDEEKDGTSAENNGKGCECEEDEDKPGCIQHIIPFGRTVNEKLIPSGKFILRREYPSPALFSPQGIVFDFNFNSYIFKQTIDISTREITIARPDNYLLTFYFSAGASIGTPSGEYRSYSSRLQMLDANGSPVTSNPVYYERLFKNGGRVRYLVATGAVDSMISAEGRIIRFDDPGIGIKIIRGGGVLRQVWSAADGLADFKVIDEYKYEIRIYSPENAGTYNSTTGIYEPTNSPYVVWTIENPLRSDTNFNKIKITQTINGTSYVHDWEYLEASKQWSVSRAGLVTKSKSRIDNYLGQCITELTKDGNGTVVYKKVSQALSYSWGESIFSETVDPGGANLKTEYTYHTDSNSPGSYSRKSTVKNPDGSWESYQYDSSGRMTLKVETYMDSAFNASANQAKATYYSYTPVDSNDTPIENDRRVRTEEVKVLGVSVSKTYYAYYFNSSGEGVHIIERAATPSNAYGNVANLRTTRICYSPSSSNDAEKGLLKSIINSDGTQVSYSYEYGTYTADPNPVSCAFTAGTGDALRITKIHGTTSSPAGVAYKTVKTTSITDEYGNNVLRETYAYDGSTYSRINWNVKTFDLEHHLLASYKSNGTETSATWNCCNKESERIADGTEYTYAYDLLKRMTSRTKKGHSGTADIVTSYTYDAEDHQLSQTVTGGTLSLSTSTEYDMTGRVTKTTDDAGLETTYAYENGGRKVTVTLPGGFTRITENYLDGRTKSITGTSVVAQYYTYGVNADGSTWTRVRSVSPSGPQWVKNTVDSLGRNIKTEQPSFTGGTIVSTSTYNSLGQLSKTSLTDETDARLKADSLYVYDSLGNQIRSGMDIDNNGSLDLASMDRISDSETLFVNESSSWWRKSTQSIYGTDNSATATVTDISKSRLTGFSGNLVSESMSTDIHGNITTSTTEIDRTNKTVTQTTDTPDSSVNSVSTTVNGLVTSNVTSTNLTYTFTYDTLGRRTGTTDPRTGTSTTSYNSTTGRVDYVEDAASNRTSFTYDSTTGRRFSTENALGKKSYVAYNDRGQVIKSWGDTVYPTENVYDEYGRMTQLKTYKGGTDWDGSTWPTAPGDADTTTWAYQASTGLMTSKTYADGNGTTYTYNNDGKLATRTWARLDDGAALTTTYSYDSATGELTGVDYSDSTTDIAYTYNRLGQQVTVTDAVGTRTFAYNSQFQLTSETISGIYTKTISRTYETSGMIGRYAGVNTGTEYDVDYGYDTYGRFSTLTNGTDVYTYSYLANSNLVSSITYPNTISVNNSYESSRDLVTSVANKYGSTNVSKYDYVNDAIGRRTSMAKSGTAFAQADTIDYGYNDRSEVISADAVTDANYNFLFNFDNIGNRNSYTTSETGSAVTSSYLTNSLNQYTSITEGSNPAVTPTMDDDGNMLNDGTWSLTWNAENRLVEAIKTDDKKLTFAYDYQGRRIRKSVYSWNGTDWNSIPDTYLEFVYDGYKLIEVLDGLDSDAITQKFVWNGEKILSVNNGTSTYYYTHDANKNVSELLDNTGTIVAHYEYSPFGKVVASTGSYKDSNPFRFSSEYTDDETGLIYYNYRYYNPSLGQWLSRDPIQEKGGINLYGMVGNNSLNFIDRLGRDILGKKEKYWHDWLYAMDNEDYQKYIKTKTQEITGERPSTPDEKAFLNENYSSYARTSIEDTPCTKEDVGKDKWNTEYTVPYKIKSKIRSWVGPWYAEPGKNLPTDGTTVMGLGVDPEHAEFILHRDEFTILGTIIIKFKVKMRCMCLSTFNKYIWVPRLKGSGERTYKYVSEVKSEVERKKEVESFYTAEGYAEIPTKYYWK